MEYIAIITFLKYCWECQNCQIKKNVSTQYFENIPLLENTLLTYFSEEQPLKNLNKTFSKLNYEKYNTHLEPHGIKVTYYSDTKIIEDKITYKNGIRNGLSEGWNKNQKLSYRINYRNGKRNGLSEDWYQSGQLWQRSNYIYEKKNGLVEVWYENSQLWKRINYKNNKRDGLYEEWYGNGELAKRINYRKDKYYGLYEEWYDNGQLSMVQNYGKRN